jgi:hypothetical protein
LVAKLVETARSSGVTTAQQRDTANGWSNRRKQQRDDGGRRGKRRVRSDESEQHESRENKQRNAARRSIHAVTRVAEAIQTI